MVLGYFGQFMDEGGGDFVDSRHCRVLRFEFDITIDIVVVVVAVAVAVAVVVIVLLVVAADVARNDTGIASF